MRRLSQNFVEYSQRGELLVSLGITLGNSEGWKTTSVEEVLLLQAQMSQKAPLPNLCNPFYGACNLLSFWKAGKLKLLSVECKGTAGREKGGGKGEKEGSQRAENH